MYEGLSAKLTFQGQLCGQWKLMTGVWHSFSPEHLRESFASAYSSLARDILPPPCCSVLTVRAHTGSVIWLWTLTAQDTWGTFLCVKANAWDYHWTGSASQQPRLQRFPAEKVARTPTWWPFLSFWVLSLPFAVCPAPTSCNENSSSGPSLFSILLTEFPIMTMMMKTLWEDSRKYKQQSH